MPDNVINILVKSENDTKEGFDSAKADAEVAGDEAGDNYSRSFLSRLHSAFSSSGEGGGGGFLSLFSLAGDSMGGTGGGVAALGALAALAQPLTVAAVAAGGLAAAFAPIAGPIMTEVSKAWDKWSGQIQKTPDAKAAIGAAGGAFTDLLGAMTPLVTSMMPSLTRLFDDIGKSATSGGIKTFFEWMSKNAPIAFDAVAHAARIFGNGIHALKPVITVIADDFKVFFRLLDIGFDLIGGIIDLFTGNWKAAGGKFRAVVNNVKGAIDDMVGAIKTELGVAWSVFKDLPGKILSALGNLGNLLFNAGKSIVQGLINGIKSMLGAVGSAAASIASKVAGFFGLSPALEGPLSGGGAPMIRGQHIGQDLAAGMLSGIGGVGSAAGRLAGAVGGGTAGGGGGGGGMTLNLGGPPESIALVKYLWPSMQLEVRTRGGGGPSSAQIALGQGAH